MSMGLLHSYVHSCVPKKITQLAFVTTFSIMGSTGEYLRPACSSMSTYGPNTWRTYRRQLYVSQVHRPILPKSQIVCPVAVRGDEMSEGSARLAQIRNRRHLSDQPIQTRAWYTSVGRATIPLLAYCSAVFQIFFTSLDAAASERQSLGASSNSLMCFGDETTVSRLFGVRTTKGFPCAFSRQFRRA